MNIVIIEDEVPAYNRLVKLLKEVVPDGNVAAHLDSIASATNWFADNEMPDAVMLDIHLADGSAFDLLKKVRISCPVIFTTAYDAYAIEAFKTSGVDYLLKPLKKDELQQAFRKIDQFKNHFQQVSAPSFPSKPGSYKTRFMVRFGEHIKTVQVSDIAYCYSENKATFARTFDGRNFPMDANLDGLEAMLDPKEFFRINRQYLISLKAIEEMRTYTKARVIVRLNPPVKEAPIVSSERAADFKSWLGGDI